MNKLYFTIVLYGLILLKAQCQEQDTEEIDSTICTNRAAKSKLQLRNPDGSFSKDPELKELAACLLSAYNILDENGDFRKDKIRKLLEGYSDFEDELIDVVMKMCLVKYPSYKETAYHMMVCLISYLDEEDYY